MLEIDAAVMTAFVALMSGIAIVIELAKKLVPKLTEQRRLLPVLPILLGGSLGYFVFTMADNIVVGILLGIMAGAMSSTGYEAIKKTILGR